MGKCHLCGALDGCIHRPPSPEDKKVEDTKEKGTINKIKEFIKK